MNDQRHWADVARWNFRVGTTDLFPGTGTTRSSSSEQRAISATGLSSWALAGNGQNIDSWQNCYPTCFTAFAVAD
eukprot:SAG22_NODE_944_length_6390_cov_3.189795_8_plen_75_part_00